MWRCELCCQGVPSSRRGLEWTHPLFVPWEGPWLCRLTPYLLVKCLLRFPAAMPGTVLDPGGCCSLGDQSHFLELTLRVRALARAQAGRVQPMSAIWIHQGSTEPIARTKTGQAAEGWVALKRGWNEPVFHLQVLYWRFVFIFHIHLNHMLPIFFSISVELTFII